MQLKTLGSGAVDVSEEAFGRAYNEALVHQVVTAYRAAGRSGTKAQKNRSQVRGGGAKPWRQKGTGRARAGTSRGPIWEGGGRTFAARPRKFDQKVNKKMYRAAMQSLVSELIRQDRLLVTENFSVDTPKTKQLASKLESLKLDNVLIVLEAFDENLYLASRNIPNVELLPVTAVDPVSLIRRKRVLFTLPALKRLEEQLK